MSIDKKRRRLIQLAGLSPIAALTSQRLVSAANSIPLRKTGGNFNPDVELALKASITEIPVLPGPYTKVWRFSGRLLKGPDNSLRETPGSYLGPTLHFRKGQKVRIRFYNELPGDCIVHWHGLHVPEVADGHPRYAIGKGESYVYEFEVNNRAGTYWYHSHTHRVTGQRVYFGLSGVLLISDDEERGLPLPVGDYDIPLVIQDRRFDDQNRLLYTDHMHDRMMGFLGDRIMVNGQPDFVLPAATRAYRLRLLNLSNSRIYKLAWSDSAPLTVIGTDGGLLEGPEQYPYITLAPAERVDLWVDFRGYKVGTEITMRSLPFHGTMPMMQGMMGGRGMGPGRRGMMGGGRQRGMGGPSMHGSRMGMRAVNLANGAEFPVFRIRIDREVRETSSLPNRLSSIPRYLPEQAANVDEPKKISLSMRPMSPSLNGRSFAMDDATAAETVKLGEMYLIEFVNRDQRMHRMMMAHPMHIHGQQFQIVHREIASGYEDAYASMSAGFVNDGWKDIVLVMPGEKVTLLKRFDDFDGLYLYHCHNLEHEDLDMMRNFLVKK